MTQDRGNRTGNVLSIRLSDRERADLDTYRRNTAGPRGWGPWLAWVVRHAVAARVLPHRAGSTVPGRILPAPVSSGITAPAARGGSGVWSRRVILDLCGGSGAWSEPYRYAGYDVRLVTLPRCDVKAYQPPDDTWGVLAAPPCTEFSQAKNGSRSRDLLTGLETVTHCLRIIALARPVWWALEHPARSLISRWIGPPVMTFEPYEYGDPHTKRTGLWGAFNPPIGGPYVEPQGSAMDRGTPAERAITPPGFARAFFEANR